LEDCPCSFHRGYLSEKANLLKSSARVKSLARITPGSTASLCMTTKFIARKAKNRHQYFRL
jgi:hypothetical protein